MIKSMGDDILTGGKGNDILSGGTVQHVEYTASHVFGDLPVLTSVFQTDGAFRADGIGNISSSYEAHVDPAEALFMHCYGMEIEGGGTCGEKGVFAFLSSSAGVCSASMEGDVQLAAAHEVEDSAAELVGCKGLVLG